MAAWLLLVVVSSDRSWLSPQGSRLALSNPFFVILDFLLAYLAQAIIRCRLGDNRPQHFDLLGVGRLRDARVHPRRATYYADFFWRLRLVDRHKVPSFRYARELYAYHCSSIGSVIPG